MSENKQQHDSCNPIIKDLRARAKRVYDNATDDKDYLLASLGVFMANVYDEGGPITSNECDSNRRKHWLKLYGVAVAVGAIIGSALNWLYKITLMKGGN